MLVTTLSMPLVLAGGGSFAPPLAGLAFIFVFCLYFYKRLLVVRSRNDEMSIDVIRMAEGVLTQFAETVLKQKELIRRHTSPRQDNSYSDDTAERLKQIKKLREQGLITEEEFEAKRKAIETLAQATEIERLSVRNESVSYSFRFLEMRNSRVSFSLSLCFQAGMEGMGCKHAPRSDTAANF